MSRLKANWFLPISLAAYLLLNMSRSKAYLAGIPVAIVIAILVAGYIPGFKQLVHQGNAMLKVFSFLSALGYCWYGYQNLYLLVVYKVSSTQRLKHLNPQLFIIPVAICALMAVAFIYVVILSLFAYSGENFKKLKTFQGMPVYELVSYGVVFLCFSVFCICLFLRTDAFYNPGGGYSFPNVIYTSDSGILVRSNVYLNLAHPENDMRQPLFAVFATPFCALPYFLSCILGNKLVFRAILENIVQLAMLIFADFLLGKTLNLKPYNRVFFVLLLCVTYSQLLFSVTMEQYIIVYFWLIICIYTLCSAKYLDPLPLYGAAGTLLTSLILLPFAVKKEGKKTEVVVWLRRACAIGAGFILVMLLFGRTDIFIHLKSSILRLSRFSGKAVSWKVKALQFISFVRDIFIAPSTEVGVNYARHSALQLVNVQSLSLIGIALLLLTVLSAVLNRKDRICQLSAFWVVFSFFILFILGWGTQENGLILYSLYFGWAYAILLFKLVIQLQDVIGLQFIVPAVASCCFAVLLICNIPGISRMVAFAVHYYPLLRFY
ncbi:hypothetical protein OZX72_01710 [Bifidobacterium sp. ESL0769]|uniref:hypothetical protein n=1 Tax=Bifidobacterium sp. ESL0769 TaxID=2983229 RepID=UPI0023F8750C|nr:hypothetical protein [Bifidobacterium sp. ESL0769]WEV67741.1 hypothetical protein OZX72_01710 [Bifidobacterium sp. ESL0769]